MLIFLFAILLRIGVHLQASANDPTYGHPRQDEKTYHGWAESFSKGEMPKDIPFAAPPFYSFVLGNTIYRIAGPNPVAAYIFNNFLALMNMYLLFLLGRKVWDTRAGLIAALVYNLYPPFIMLEVHVMVTTFYITFLLLAIYWGMLARDREKPAAFLIAGIIMGLATIARPTFAIFIPFYLFWLFHALRPLRIWLPAVALIVAGFILPILPVTLTNLVAGKDFVPLTTTAGINFYIGNSEGAMGVLRNPEGFRDISLRHILEDAERIAEAESGRQMKPSEVSSYFMVEGVKYLAENPGHGPRLIYWKFRLLTNRLEIGDVWDYYTSLKDVSLYRWLNITFATVITLGALGIALTWGANRNVSLLTYFLLAFTILQLVFFVNTRFRLPFTAMLCLFAGVAISALVGGKLHFKRIIIGGIIGFLALLLTIAPLTWFSTEGIYGEHYNRGLHYLAQDEPEKARSEFLAELEANPGDARIYAQLGITELRLGNSGAGEEYFLKALQIAPGNEVVLDRYGQFLLEIGRYDEAEVALRKALQVVPDDPGVSYYLADLLFRTDRFGEAYELAKALSIDGEDSVRILQLLGMIQIETGRIDEAYDTFNKALEADLENARSWYCFGTTLNRMGDFSEALGAFAEVEVLSPEYPGLKLAVGDAWLGKGDTQRARDAYLAGIEAEPDSFELYHNLALAYRRLNEPDAARDAFLQAIEIKPDYYQAYYNLAILYLTLADTAAAIANFEKTLEINPNFIPGLQNLGSTYANLGEYDKARIHWEKVISIAPGTQAATVARNSIDALEE